VLVVWVWYFVIWGMVWFGFGFGSRWPSPRLLRDVRVSSFSFVCRMCMMMGT
jgi:hypothetical protein